MKATYNNDGIKNRFIEALPPMLSGEELAKTVSRYPSSVYDIPELGAFDSEFNLVLDAIWRTQYLRQYQPLTDDLRKYLFDKCGGITDVLIKLLYYGQRRAIESGTEKLTVPLFEKVSNSILKMELDSMNKGLKESVSDVRWDIRNA